MTGKDIGEVEAALESEGGVGTSTRICIAVKDSIQIALLAWDGDRASKDRASRDRARPRSRCSNRDQQMAQEHTESQDERDGAVPGAADRARLDHPRRVEPICLDQSTL